MFKFLDSKCFKGLFIRIFVKHHVYKCNFSIYESYKYYKFINCSLLSKANLLKVLTKDFGSEFDELLPGMFANRNIYDAKLLNEAVKV